MDRAIGMYYWMPCYREGLLHYLSWGRITNWYLRIYWWGTYGCAPGNPICSLPWICWGKVQRTYRPKPIPTCACSRSAWMWIIFLKRIWEAGHGIGLLLNPLKILVRPPIILGRDW